MHPGAVRSLSDTFLLRFLFLSVYQKKDFQLVLRTLLNIPPVHKLVAQTASQSRLELKKTLDWTDPLAYPLLHW